MNNIFKYELEMKDEQIIYMPENATILTCQYQKEILCIWALVVPERKHKQPRKILIIGTGADIENASGLKYISTVQQEPFVWHIFEETK